MEKDSERERDALGTPCDLSVCKTIADTVTSMWDENPLARPSFSDVVPIFSNCRFKWAGDAQVWRDSFKTSPASSFVVERTVSSRRTQ